MKVLWVINIMIPEIAEKLKLPSSNREGWLSGLFGKMVDNNKKYELAIAYPVGMDSEDKSLEELKVGNISCYGFREDLSAPEWLDEDLETEFNRIIGKVKPDILHIFGTEFPHALMAAKAFGKPDKTLVGIQGVCTKIAEDYMALIPESIQNMVTFRDYIRKDSIKDQKKKFSSRGKNEVSLIKYVNHVTGRTEFDEAFVKEINDTATYYKMNETMRDSFYTGDVWNIKDAVPHSIFLGQGDYPIKGMHFLLNACAVLLKSYPDLTINVAGNSIINCASLKDYIKTPAYGLYLRNLIKENKLKGHVNVLGSLDANKMKCEYLKNSVFVCPSYMENSPNTVAEAMLLGMPLVVSDAGGITSVISNKEGLIVSRGSSDELAFAIRKIWEEEENNAASLFERCDNARIRAALDYNGEQNYNRLLDIYSKINV